MNADFSFADMIFTALPSGALWCAAHGALCVSDLHLGKSERMARRSGMLLPPYETQATLERLGAEIARLQPDTVISLGDSFDDLHAAHALAPAQRDSLNALITGRRWIWVEGNHDAGVTGFDGVHVAEFTLGTVTFRHIATDHPAPEISGHYHPKAGLMLRGRHIRSACFVMGDSRLILPAFGAYTGGLDVGHPALRALFTQDATVRMIRAPHHAIPLHLCL